MSRLFNDRGYNENLFQWLNWLMSKRIFLKMAQVIVKTLFLAQVIVKDHVAI